MDFIVRKISKRFPYDAEKGFIGSLDLSLQMGRCFVVPFPRKEEITEKPKKSLFYVFFCILNVLAYVYIYFELVDMWVSRSNLDALSQNICLTLTHFAGVYKVLNIAFHPKEMIDIIGKLRRMIKKYVISKEQKRTFISLESDNMKVLIVYVNTVAANVFLATFILIENDNFAGNYFPYRSLLPKALPLFLRKIYHATIVFMVAFQIVACDLVNINLINQIRCQLKILNHSLFGLSLESCSGPIPQLHGCIQHHQHILEIRNKIERIFRFPILVQFFLALLIFAMTGFQAAMQSTISSKSAMLYLYSCCVLIQLFIYCWFASQVMEQNESLAAMGYSTAWYAFGRPYSQKLCIFLINAQRPLGFTCGGFFYLSLITFKEIMSKSYSFIALLRQFYADY